uniref:tumor suppressor candidate 2 n=1 Tax=Urocitellus parryii TaxID=9999 RepID=UPI000E55B13F|nr:tumor suppressor candidate 2 [Urocitellus parryii]
MGASGSKARGLWPFTSTTGGGGPEAAGSEQALVRPRGRPVPPFVFTRRGSMFYDEDGDLAHEFYEETIVTKNGQKRAKLRRVHKNLIQGQQEVRRKGWNGRRELVGGNGVYQVASGLPSGQQLVKVSWLEKFTPGRREAADLPGRRTPRQARGGKGAGGADADL